MFVAWGPALTAFYNDGFIPILSGKHPGALGQPSAALWAELGAEVGAVVEVNLAGEAQLAGDQPIVLVGHPAGSVSWFTFTFSPLRDDAGAIAGFWCMATETTSRIRAEMALRDSEAHVASSIGALRQISDASSRLWRARNLREGLDEMLGAAIELVGADKSSFQLADASRGVLTLAAQRGFDQTAIDRFREVMIGEETACVRALRSGERVAVEDIEADAGFPPYLSFADGIRSVQTTPMLARDGTLLGALSTYFAAARRPADAEMQRLDLYVRQAGDFIERCRTEEALREREKRLRAIVDTFVDAVIVTNEDGVIQSINPAGERILGYSPGKLTGKNVALLIRSRWSACR